MPIVLVNGAKLYIMSRFDKQVKDSRESETVKFSVVR